MFRAFFFSYISTMKFMLIKNFKNLIRRDYSPIGSLLKKKFKKMLIGWNKIGIVIGLYLKYFYLEKLFLFWVQFIISILREQLYFYKKLKKIKMHQFYRHKLFGYFHLFLKTKNLLGSQRPVCRLQTSEPLQMDGFFGKEIK